MATRSSDLLNTLREHEWRHLPQHHINKRRERYGYDEYNETQQQRNVRPMHALPLSSSSSPIHNNNSVTSSFEYNDLALGESKTSDSNRQRLYIDGEHQRNTYASIIDPYITLSGKTLVGSESSSLSKPFNDDDDGEGIEDSSSDGSGKSVDDLLEGASESLKNLHLASTRNAYSTLTKPVDEIEEACEFFTTFESLSINNSNSKDGDGNSSSNGVGKSSRSTIDGLKIGKWSKLANAAIAQYERDEASFKDNLTLHTRGYYSDIGFHDAIQSNGAKRERDILRAVNQMGFQLADYQLRFVMMVVDAARPYIYGKGEYEQSREEIYNRTGQKEVNPWILCQTPRRFGKTTMVAMVVAALVAHTPGIKIGIFSTVGRTSKKMMSEIKKFLKKLDPKMQERFCKDTVEELHVLPAGTTNVRTADDDIVARIYSYPASVRGTRGFTVDITLIDEAAHMDVEVWRQSIVPALGTKNHVLIAITTAQGPTNFFSQLMMKRSSADGSPLFAVMCIQLACSKCQSRGTPELCTHTAKTRPTWKPAETEQRIKDLFGDEDRELYNQEVVGIQNAEGNMVYCPRALSRWEGRAPVWLSHRPRRIYTFIDPSGGSKKISSQAIVSIVVYNNSHRAIVGIDTWCGQDAHGAKQSILDHLYALRRHELFGSGQYGAPIRILYEANLSKITADERTTMIEEMLGSDNVEIEKYTMGDMTEIPGVWTTPAIRTGSIHNLQSLLINDRLHFAYQFVSRDVVNTKRDCLQQLRVFYENRRPGSDPAMSERTKSFMSGKTAAGQQDDIAMALALGLWWMNDHLRKTQQFTTMASSLLPSSSSSTTSTTTTTAATRSGGGNNRH